VVFGLMNRNNEILALRSGGVSVYMLLKPLLAIGLVFSILLFLFSEVVVPLTAARANRIWMQDVKNKSAVISREKNIWIRGDRSFVHIKYFNPVSEIVYGVTLHFFDEKFTLTRRVDAKMGGFADGRWMLKNLMEQVLNPKTGEYHTAFLEEKEEIFDFAPEELGRVAKKSEEMNFRELSSYIQKINSEGYDASAYEVDLHAKIAFPFVCIVLCFAGAGISLRLKTADGIGAGVAFGIGAAFLYWTFYSFCLSLGYGEMLPPFVAAWTANAAFVCYTAIALLNAD
jgi:lipopolysaccharide export system permease protein